MIVRNNPPEALERALGPARDQGLLPLFPFGTDFTAPEQRLIPALNNLRDASASPVQLLQLLMTGLRAGEPSAEIKECLSRMRLDAPKSLGELAKSALLRGALEPGAAKR
jgi:hypothetical protein